MADSGLIAVDSVAINGREVLLTLNRAVTAANNVLVRYDKPTDPSAMFLRGHQRQPRAGCSAFGVAARRQRRTPIVGAAAEGPIGFLKRLMADFPRHCG